MNIRHKARTVVSDEKGGVSVDWVVLAAAIAGLAIAALSVIRPGSSEPDSSRASHLAASAPTAKPTFP